MRYKGQRTARQNERDFPHIVEQLLPPGGFGMTLIRMHDWDRSRGLEIRHGRGRRAEDRNYIRWCFSEASAAETFITEYGGTIVVPSTRG